MLQTIINVTTKSGAQYIFTIVGNVVKADRYEGNVPSCDVASQRPIGHLRNMPLECLPNILIGRCLFIRRLGQYAPIVSSPVTDVSAISSYISE